MPGPCRVRTICMRCQQNIPVAHGYVLRCRPATFVGGVFLPLLGIAYVSYLLASRCLPRSRTAGLQAAAVAVSDSAAASYARRAVAIASPHATRVCVSLYFLHEGGQVSRVLTRTSLLCCV
eukprot:1237471-Pleurochrysis_carterae.AAC.1